MSTVISGGYPMAENIHKDFQSNNLFGRDIGDLAFSLQTMPLGTNDKFPPFNNAPLGGIWPLQRPASVERRNSTSSVSSISSARNHLNMNSLTSMANIIPESTTATITAATSGSNPTFEERFRGRAYSEGASLLSTDTNLQPQQQPIASNRYKTELCRPFQENGKCKYGDKCQFAHGKQEVRHLIRHPKYKTELCRTFHTSGFCPYGPRCHFIHNHDSGNRSNTALQAAASFPQQQPSKPITQGVPMAVPNPHISERNHFGRRPAHLNLLTKQLSTGSTIRNLPYHSSLGGSPPYYQQDLGCSALMSPTSPNSVNNGIMFNFSNPAAALASYMMNAQFDSTFEILLSQGTQYETTVNDDSAFEGSMTPPDSDHESMTGSPPEKQRLPIFRCLSQA